MIFHVVLFVTFIVLNVASEEVYRLPKTIKPLRYRLTMEPHLRDGYRPTNHMSIPFEGSVVIELNVLENTKNITLHQVGLTINESDITIVDTNQNVLKVRAASNDTDNETYTIQLENELVKGDSYTVHIRSFTGYLGESIGFFIAYYYNAATEPGPRKRPLAATYFKPTGARRAFPCFDEPNLKARFIVSLIRTVEFTSVSNEGLHKTEDLGDGRFKDTFKETPLMSTFTLAFAITSYKYTEKLDRYRILARPKLIDDGSWKFSLDISNRTLIALEEYTGINFVINKMDQIAIPDNFFYETAMESWGLVVYAESHLIRNNRSSAVGDKRSALCIAHEFAHQWFGNLVTPDWWDHLWLSESVAAYLNYYIADAVEPSWRLKEQFVVDTVQEAFVKEADRGAYPMNANIKPASWDTSFYSYPMNQKGASIIRMMEHFLTHDVFRRGIQIYLEKHKFSNTVPSNFYAAFQEAVNNAGTTNLLNDLSVAEIMKSWENNKGFPIITVTRDYKTGELTIEQGARFEEEGNTTNTKWTVPINYIFSAVGKLDFTKTSADYWLTETKATINHDFPTNGWVILDKQSTGYYRVNYDLENWKRIIETLKSENFESINVLNRAKLIDDAFNLAYIGKLSWEIPASLSEYIIQERDYIALNPFYRAMDHIFYIIYIHAKDENPESLQQFLRYIVSNDSVPHNSTENDKTKKYVKTTLAGIKERIGFEEKPDDTHEDKIHREKFLQLKTLFE